MNSRSRFGHSGRRSGFTLIELLIVVAIIGLLITVLVSVLLGALTHGKEGEAKNFIENVMPPAMKAWQDKNGKKESRFPSSGNDYSSKTAGNVLLFKELVAKPREAGIAPFVDMAAGKEDKVGDDAVFVDPWGTPYVYYDWSSPPPKNGNSSNAGSGSVKPYNEGSYDIISAGPDKEFDTPDDIIRGGFSPKEKQTDGKKKPVTPSK